jgi:predicted nucleic acid-binding protein
VLRLLWDASALLKRYVREAGAGTVDALFAEARVVAKVTTIATYTETAATLRRRANQNAVSLREFRAARLHLEEDILDDPAVELLSLGDADFLSSIPLIDRHNLNSSDAVQLRRYLTYSREPHVRSSATVLVASDRRLLRAAAAEGLHTLNPETVGAERLPGFLSAL